MRQMRFERDTFLFGHWCQGTLSGMQSSGGCQTLRLSLCSSVHCNLSFSYSAAQDKLKILYRFIKDRIQVYRRIQYRGFQRVTAGIRNWRVYRDRAHYVNKGGRLVGMWLTWNSFPAPKGQQLLSPADCSYVKIMSLLFQQRLQTQVFL